MTSWKKQKTMSVLILFECTKDGNLQSIQEIFQNNFAYNVTTIGKCLQLKDDYGRTLMHWAAYFGHFAIIQFFLEYKDQFNLRALDNFRYDALNLAVIRGYNGEFTQNNQVEQLKIINLLLENGLNFLNNPKGEYTCLHWACFTDNYQLVCEIIKNSDELIYQTNKEGEFPVDVIFKEFKNGKLRTNQGLIYDYIVRWYLFKNGSSTSPTKKRSITLENDQRADIEQEVKEPKPNIPYKMTLQKQQPYLRGLTISKTQSLKNQFHQNLSLTDEPNINLPALNVGQKMMTSPYGSQFPSQLRPKPLKVKVEKLIINKFYEPAEYDSRIQIPSEGDFQDQDQVQNPIKEECQIYKIFPEESVLTTFEILDLKFLYWASYLGKVDLCYSLLNRKTNPFTLSCNQQSAFHIAAIRAQTQVLSIFLENPFEYWIGKKKQTKFFDKISAANRMTGTTPSSALHFAIESEHIPTIKLLLKHGCSIESVNFRTLMPFELTREQKITKYYITQLKPVDPYNFVEQQFYYVLQTPFKKTISECIVNIQLMNIKQTCEDLGVPFDYITIFSSEKDNKDQSCFYYVIKLQEKTLNYWAHELELRCFNFKQSIITKYDIDECQDFERFKDLQIQQIILHLLNMEFDVDVFMQEKLLLSHFPLHNLTVRKKIKTFWKQEQLNCMMDPFRPQTNPESLKPLHIMSSYYGPKVGWYFAFLCQFIIWLVIPTIPGIGIGIYMVVTKQFQTALMPIYSIFMNLWATIFIEGWKRRESELAFFWDMHEFSQREPVRYQYQGQYVFDYATNKIQIKAKISAFVKRLIMDGPVIILGLIILFANFYLFQTIMNMYQDNLYALVAIGIANGISINVVSFIYSVICQKVVEWENHKVQSELEMSYVFKVFIFEFFNSYLGAGYQAIYIGDYFLLTITVGAVIITRGLIHNFVTNLIPIVIFLYRQKKYFAQYSNYLFKHAKKLQLQNTATRKNLKQENLQKMIIDLYFNIKIEDLCDQSQCSQQLTLKQVLSFQEQLEFNSVMLSNKDLIDEYMYLAILFGYITMFSPVFPIAPLFVIINVFINLKLSVYNYQHQMKREQAQAADSIGIWIDIFSVMNYFSTVMNCVVIWRTSSQQLATLLGEGNELRDAIALFVVEHLIVLVKFMLDRGIPDVPKWVEKAKKRYEFLEQRAFDLQLESKK